MSFQPLQGNWRYRCPSQQGHCVSVRTASRSQPSSLQQDRIIRSLGGLAVAEAQCNDTIRYDTRCYFNVRSKADISQLNLPHGTDN